MNFKSSPGLVKKKYQMPAPMMPPQQDRRSSPPHPPPMRFIIMLLLAAFFLMGFRGASSSSSSSSGSARREGLPALTAVPPRSSSSSSGTATRFLGFSETAVSCSCSSTTSVAPHSGHLAFLPRCFSSTLRTLPHEQLRVMAMTKDTSVDAKRFPEDRGVDCLFYQG